MAPKNKKLRSIKFTKMSLQPQKSGHIKNVQKEGKEKEKKQVQASSISLTQKLPRELWATSAGEEYIIQHFILTLKNTCYIYFDVQTPIRL